MYEHGVPGGALNLNSTGYPDHGRYGDLSLQGKIPTAEPGIETLWLVVRGSDHQATSLVLDSDIPFNILYIKEGEKIRTNNIPTTTQCQRYYCVLLIEINFNWMYVHVCQTPTIKVQELRLRFSFLSSHKM
jgi:hypothetical protein